MSPFAIGSVVKVRGGTPFAYRAMLEAQRIVVFDIVVPVGLDERIRRLLPAIGYEMNMFVSISLMRRVNEVADYEDDEQERFGEEYE